MTTELPQEAIAAVLNGMVAAFEGEREQSEPFKEMFKAGSTFTGLLRHLESVGMGAALDASTVLEQKHGVWVSRPVLEFLLALPYLSYKLEKHIERTEGVSCCVDKSFFLLSEELKRLIQANPEPQA